MQQVAQAIAHIHRNGIAHRMLSLDCIYINENNQPIIAHFWNSITFAPTILAPSSSAALPLADVVESSLRDFVMDSNINHKMSYVTPEEREFIAPELASYTTINTISVSTVKTNISVFEAKLQEARQAAERASHPIGSPKRTNSTTMITNKEIDHTSKNFPTSSSHPNNTESTSSSPHFADIWSFGVILAKAFFTERTTVAAVPGSSY